MIERDEVFRVKTDNTPGVLARVLAAIAEHGAHVGEIHTLSLGHDHNIREITVIAPNEEAIEPIHDAIAATEGVEIVAEHLDRVFSVHETGKIRVIPTVEVRTLQDMRAVYTPGVARVSSAIADDASLANRLTWRNNTIAVVSDGSRVLGLGNIGPRAALPVMEGKAMFYSMFVDISAVPIVLDTQDPEAIIETVTNIAPGFGGIHLEDIASPGVYRIEDELDARLDVPVFHDDQHGTAVVVLAAIISVANKLDRDLSTLSFGQVGLGAAGSAIARLALEFPFSSVHVFDPTPAAVERVTAGDQGTVSVEPDMATVAQRADVLVLTTGRPGVLTPDMIQDGQVVMAITNPVPEISRHDALAAGAAIATDGSIVNNVLAYPGLFRGALDAGVGSITSAMKRAAAETLAELAPDDLLLPDPLDRSVHTSVAARVANAAE